ncbi:MAG: alpha-amylase family glycosyl hydrolase [Phycisphaerales bacterium]|jgi:glycosidase|nr:alpha-amylase family glycosyl hydrolase [Phycisphaerales bacterium]
MTLVPLLLSITLGGWPPALPIVEPGLSTRTSLPPSVSANDRGERWICRFALNGHADADEVMLAGDFNGWNPTATPMTLHGGTWRVTVPLEPGVRWYKYVVDGNWMADPQNQDRQHDGHGGNNSVLRLGPAANVDPSTARRGDERIEGAAVNHFPEQWSDSAGGPDNRTLRMRTLAGDVDAVSLAQPWIGSTPTRPVLDDGRFQWWEVTVPIPQGDDRYTFLIHDGAATQRSPHIYRFSETSMHLETPDWARDAVWYQIMVDRFRNGDPQTDPQPGRAWTSDWYAPALNEGEDGQGFYDWYVFSRLYGGDLAGLREKLGYLRELGINALYLNPVFQSESHHKYNATSFVHIDEHYGGGLDYTAAEAAEQPADASTWSWTESDLAFLDFLREAKAMGFRVIIDGVFNHVGTRHPAFRDVQSRGKASEYADWFAVKSWEPFDYEGWAGFGELPVFAKNDEHGLASASVRQHIMEITRRWMDPDGDGDPSDGIDGWRLDVPNEVPLPFWIEWRKHVKSINPDALIVGEIWDRAEHWLDGRSFDAVMNYPFAEVTLDWITGNERKISASEAERQFARLRLAYPDAATYVLQNLLDSHDTDRLVSKVYNPDRPYDAQNREQEVEDYKAGKPPAWAYDKARLAALLQMTYVGAPMVYYGDEAGMWGSDDPNNRKPMLWEDLQPYDDPDMRIMPDHLDFYRKAIALRQSHAALRRGTIETIVLDDAQDVWVFLREFEDDRVLVALNAGDEAAEVVLPSSLGAEWTEVFASSPPTAASWPSVTIPPTGGIVWTAP